jgi:hypothetical protein
MECCQVCCEKINNSNHKKVECPFCDLKSCRSCSQKYLLSTMEDPHCMGCKHEHNRELVDTYCSAVFRNVHYRKHRENVLFEREKARLPETQPYVIRELKKRSLRSSYVYMYFILGQIDYESDLSEYAKSALKEEIKIAIMNIYEELRGMADVNPVINNDHVYTQTCFNDECNGFLDENFVCGICTTSFCSKCHEKMTPTHKCNKDTVKTVKLIKKDTRPCPKCGVLIHKIEGCAQIWCTQCQTAFDWKTGRVETGRIHNPHYFEFKKRSREHGDIPCGGRPSHRELVEMNAPDMILLISLEMLRLDYDNTYRFGFLYEDNRYLRMKFLLNEMSETELKRELQFRDKYNSKTRDVRDIYTMYTDTAGDLLRQYVLDVSAEDAIIDELIELTMYTNTVIERIRARYRSRTPPNIIL